MISRRLASDTPRGERVGAGGLFTNVRDLLRWDQQIADVVIDDEFPQPKPTPGQTPAAGTGSAQRSDSPPSPAAGPVAAGAAGVYTSSELDATFTVTAQNGLYC